MERTHKYENDELDAALMARPFLFANLDTLVQRYLSLKHKPGLAFQKSEDVALAELQTYAPILAELLRRLLVEIETEIE